MQQKLFKILLINFSILAYVSKQECYQVLRGVNPFADASRIQQLETGHFSIYPAQPVNRYNQYTVTFSQTNFTQSKLGVSLSLIYIENYYDNIIDFTILPASITKNSFLARLSINKLAKWTKAHVHYIASSLDYLKCNYSIVQDRSLLQPNPNPKTISLPKLIADQVILSSNLSVFPSICGIKIQQTNFDIKISNAVVSGKQKHLQIPIKIGKSTNPFQLLYISYFVYVNLRRAVVEPPSIVDSYGFLVKVLENKLEERSVSGLLGFNGSYLNKLLQNNMGKRRLLGTQKQQEIYVQAFFITDFGKIVNRQSQPLQLIYKNNNKNTQNSLKERCYSYQQCINAEGTITQFKNSSYGCILCPTNKYYDSQLQKCVCAQGYIPFSEEECISVKEYCGPDTVYQNGTCYQATKRPQDICQLRQNFKIDPKTNTCICQDGFILVKIPGGTTNCVKCPPQTVFNATTLRCQCANGLLLIGDICSARCGTNQQYSDSSKKCECTPNSYRNILDKCVICGSNSKFNSEKKLCECISGYFGTGTVCRKIQIKSNIQVLRVKQISL